MRAWIIISALLICYAIRPELTWPATIGHLIIVGIILAVMLDLFELSQKYQ